MSRPSRPAAGACLLGLALALAGCGDNPAPVGQLPTAAQPAATIAPTSSASAAEPSVASVARDPAATTAAPVPTAEPSPFPPPSATPCASPGQVVTFTYPSAIAGPERDARLYLPPCYGQDGRAYPTLYIFHGSIQDDSHWDTLGLDEAAETLIAAGEIPPLVIVMPDGGWIAQNSSGGPYSFEGVILNELIPHVEATTCAWAAAEGRAIGGLSRGGYWALEIAFRHPEQFASVGGHSAALLDAAAGPDLNPQHTGLSGTLGDLRIYLDIGADDYLIANIRRLHEEMAAAGVPHIWILNEGRHEDGYWSAHAADYLRWYAAAWPLDRLSYPACAP